MYYYNPGDCGSLSGDLCCLDAHGRPTGVMAASGTVCQLVDGRVVEAVPGGVILSAKAPQYKVPSIRHAIAWSRPWGE